ncbi:retrovirus-related pol polyprotein from transposon TNT 1-94 [Tanacetum coccineum]|uniref:Retrovirus-related pol polyprotein from transposon TNT 1-94 n=1 Tax=Tanacetum coccineum TaxID=301880 RepID=A0ABQ5F3B3_9ASTR
MIGPLMRYSEKGYLTSTIFMVFNTRIQQIKETYHVIFDESIEAIRFINTLVDEIGIDYSTRYPLDEFLQEDDPSRQYQIDYDISYYIIPHGRSLTELTQEKHVPQVIAPNEQSNPQIEDVEGPPDPSNTEETQENQNEQINHQLIEETLGNNTETSVPITESLVPEVIQSHQVSTSSYHSPQDRWSKDQHIDLVNIISDPGEGMLTRSMVAKLTAASASECLFVDFLSEIEPKKTLVPLPYGKTTIGSKWVFRNKKDEHGIVTRNKARLVIQGYSQEEGIDYDETFAPVARMEAIMIFLAFATYMNFTVFQMNVKSAFLNGKLKEEVYVKQPPGFESSEFPNYFEKLMTKKFEMSMMGELTYFLGLQIKQDDKGISIFQEQYTKNLLKKYEISDSSSVKNPMVPLNNLGHDLAGKPVNDTLYRGMIGSLMYMKGTPSLGLYYPKCLGFDLKGYSDSDYAGCNMDRKSTSAKAEYVVAIGCCAYILWMKSQLSDYDIHYKMVPIFCDNTNAIAISNNLVLHSRTNHIDIIYHFIRDHILKGDIELHFIPTEYQLADIFTKPLDKPTFTRLKAELGMLNID